MYFPFIITISYMYWAVKHTGTSYHNPTDQEFACVLVNTIISDLIYSYAYFFCDIFADSFSFWRFIGFILAQDVYFYTVHKLFHKYAIDWHSKHHKYFSPFNAWHEHPVSHILINLGSVAVPFWLFNNPSWVLFCIVCAQTFSSVTGHRIDTPHYVHHLDSNKRLGSIYLVDRFFRSY